MRIMKSMLCASLLVLLVGCKSISKIPVPKGNENPIVAVAKKAPLTEDQKQNWMHLDLLKDSIPGMSVNLAYNFLEGKTGKTVIVAIVDSGTDLEHEDLKPNAWVNTDEIAGNGIDDDKNGFVDDIHGWNFLGKIYKENAELYRIIKDTSLVDSATLKRAKSAYKKNLEEAEQNKKQYGQILQAAQFADKVIKENLKNDDYKKEDVKKLASSSNDQVKRAVAIANYLYGLGVSSLQEAIDELTGLVEGADDLLSGAVLKKDYRKVLNNDENTMDVKIYGDANILPSEKKESHGSHVTGIIGAVRNNGIGMNGVANKVKLMSVRAVPDGDEYDKDVALAIRYAVDNGAKVINTSFGKGYSPKVQWVYDAIKYAAKKDVLIVNAAGNDSKNIDKTLTFPNDTPDNIHELSDNVLTVGAMSSAYDENLPATFTNYGKNNVDVFAPGVKIYSTTPENEYGFKNGTSMASPAVAGVAALIRSYYPELTASQVKRIIMNSGTKIDIKVVKPGSQTPSDPKGEMVSFLDLSKTGRVVNALNALKMADAMINK